MAKIKAVHYWKPNYPHMFLCGRERMFGPPPKFEMLEKQTITLSKITCMDCISEARAQLTQARKKAVR
jgi:hypothetical protein